MVRSPPHPEVFDACHGRARRSTDWKSVPEGAHFSSQALPRNSSVGNFSFLLCLGGKCTGPENLITSSVPCVLRRNFPHKFFQLWPEQTLGVSFPLSLEVPWRSPPQTPELSLSCQFLFRKWGRGLFVCPFGEECPLLGGEVEP